MKGLTPEQRRDYWERVRRRGEEAVAAYDKMILEAGPGDEPLLAEEGCAPEPTPTQRAFLEGEGELVVHGGARKHGLTYAQEAIAKHHLGAGGTVTFMQRRKGVRIPLLPHDDRVDALSFVAEQTARQKLYRAQSAGVVPLLPNIRPKPKLYSRGAGFMGAMAALEGFE